MDLCFTGRVLPPLLCRHYSPEYPSDHLAPWQYAGTAPRSLQLSRDPPGQEHIDHLDPESKQIHVNRTLLKGGGSRWLLDRSKWLLTRHRSEGTHCSSGFLQAAALAIG